MIRFQKKTWFARTLREIEHADGKVVLREGRAKKKIGNPWDPIEEAKATEHLFAGLHEARRFVRETRVRWNAEGYEEATPLSLQRAPSQDQPYCAKRNPALEAEVFREGTTGQAIHVLADWLMQEGDPRGALIHEMTHAEEGGPDEIKRAREERALMLLWSAADLPEADRVLLRSTYNDGYLSFTWKAGSVDKCWIECPREASGTDLFANRFAAAVSSLLSCALFAFLHELIVIVGGPELARDPLYKVLFCSAPEEPDDTRAGALTIPDSVRVLRVEVGTDSDSMIGDASVFRAYPRLLHLRSLSLSGVETVDLGPRISVPGLCSLSIAPRILTTANIQALAASELPRLDRLALSLWDGHEWEESHFSARDLAPLFKTKSLPALKHLALRATMPEGDDFEMLEALLTSPLLRQLSTLSLQSYFFHTVEMAHTSLDLFLRYKDNLAHLEVLDLSGDTTWAQFFPDNARDLKAASRSDALRNLAKRVLL